MENIRNGIVVVLRVAFGWLFLYAGITKILDPEWSAAGYLENAKTFPDFFARFMQPDILPIVNIVNEWGLTLLGVSLILGAFTRWSSVLGALLMMLYYFPALNFPYPNAHSYIVDEHVIYALLLLYFAVRNPGKVLGVDGLRS